MSIQIRNRFKKEIDILINRVSVLQEQELQYKNLTLQISNLKLKLIGLNKKEKDITQAIDIKTLQSKDLAQKIVEGGGALKKQEKNIENTKIKAANTTESYKKQSNLFDQDLENKKLQIEEIDTKVNNKKQELKDIEQKHKDFEAELMRDKNDLFAKVKENETLLKKQDKTKKNISQEIKKLNNDYDELDEKYQILLENYIIKQYE